MATEGGAPFAGATARFHVGEIVELDATGFLPGASLQTGDRGTVVRKGRVNEFGAMETRVLWHKDGRESGMVEYRLRMYTNPMDAPGRSKGAFDTMRALRVVIREEQPHAVEEVIRDMERARMTAEDLRTASFSPYVTNKTPGVLLRDDPNWRYQTWREFAVERNETCDELLDKIGEATSILDDARGAGVGKSARRALQDAREKMTDAILALDSDYDEDE